MIAEKLPVTLELASLSMLIAVTIGVPAGVFAALHRGSLIDYGVSVVGLAGLSMGSAEGRVLERIERPAGAFRTGAGRIIRINRPPAGHCERSQTPRGPVGSWHWAPDSVDCSSNCRSARRP